MRAALLPLDRVPAADYARLAGPSFFISPGFLSLWRWMGGRPVVWTVESGGALAAVLPGVEYGRGPLTRFASLPDGCYGGLRVSEDADRAAAARLLFAALARRGYAKASIFDFHGTTPPPPGFDVVRCETRLVDISGPDWSPPDRKLQSQIRKAGREGIRVERFDWDRHHSGFLRLVALTAARQGRRPRYSRAFFRALAGLAERDERVVWRWCAHAGRPAAAQIYFVEQGALQAWQSYYDRSCSFLKPNQYIRLEVCREAAERGLRRLNLGASPADANGLTRYKARWGGRSATYPCYLRYEGLGRLAARLAGDRPADAGVGAAWPDPADGSHG